MRFAGPLTLLAIWVGLAAPAHAKLSFQARLGWDGNVRSARWNPVFITLQDDTARAVELEIEAPRDSSQATRTALSATAGPTAQTYVMYAPLVFGHDPITLKVYDAQTHKTIVESRMFDVDAVTVSEGPAVVGGVEQFDSGVFIGVSGREPALRSLASRASEHRAAVGFLKPFELPQTPIGYDCLDLLVLNQPDLNQMEGTQKRALLDWVRSGGCLLVWFGAEPLSASDPIVQALPCTVGDHTALNIDASALAYAGLPRRFAKLGGRILVPAAGAQVTEVLGGGGAKCVRHRVGFGQIAVLSFDGSALQFDNNQDADRFWQPLIAASGVPAAGATPGDHPHRDYSTGGASASATVMDLLGGVPGVGTFGFGYVAATLILLMLVVGPVDWLLLRWLGRQPWTWVTTSGWIGLVTVGAIYAGHLVRSGDLHFRTLRVIDQADDAVVSRNDFVGIYSPRTTEYEMELPANSWWEPVSGDTYYYSSSAVVTMFNARQTTRDTLPDPRNPMTIPVWNLRFLGGQTTEKAPPVLAIKLAAVGPWRGDRRPGGTGPGRIVGSITNLTAATLTQLDLRAYGHTLPGGLGPREGAKWPERLAAHATAEIDVPLGANPHRPAAPIYHRTVVPVGGHGEPLVTADQVVSAALMLTGRGTARAEALMNPPPTEGFPDVACVTALSEDAGPTITLKDQTPVQKHWMVVRALVPVTRTKNER